MNTKWISLLAAALILPIGIQTAAAAPQTLSQDDTWLIGAHQSNLAEIDAGRLAEKSGHTAAVRNAGRMLVTDHTKLDAKLKPVAKELGVKLPEQPNLAQRNQIKYFETLSGMKFDKAWAHDEAGDHVKAIGQTESEIHNGSNPQVKQLAESALPVLKKHLSTLKQVSTEITGS